MDGEELLARCFQHEIDHLNGTLFIFRMSPLKRNLVCAGLEAAGRRRVVDSHPNDKERR